jgi:biotin carboxyl carrier protein
MARAAAAAVIAVAAALGCGGEPAVKAVGEPARTAVVGRGDVVDRQVISGELRAAQATWFAVPRTETWQLAVRWLAEDGALVAAGDRVLEFDNSSFTAQLEEKRLAVLEAEMAFRGAQDISAIETASKDTELRQHQIALDKATVHAEVPADLLTVREGQDRQLARKRAEVAVDKAAHELTAQREEAALQLRIKQIDLDKVKRAIAAADKTIAELVVTAPRAGMVVIGDHPWLGRKFRIGDTVQPGMTIASLPDMGQGLEVRAELSDVDDGRITVGMTGVCTLDAYPRDALPCAVKDITPVARTRNESSLRRAFGVVLGLGLDKIDADRMRPGMSVKVELHPKLERNAVIVPRGAVIAAADKRPARVRMANGELRTIALGPCDAQGCAVTSGLAAGDAVVLGGAP